jgi:hypothetical protein
MIRGARFIFAWTSTQRPQNDRKIDQRADPELTRNGSAERCSKILYCAFGVSEVLGFGAAPVGAAFFFFFFGAALDCGASLGC